MKAILKVFILTAIIFGLTGLTFVSVSEAFGNGRSAIDGGDCGKKRNRKVRSKEKHECENSNRDKADDDSNSNGNRNSNENSNGNRNTR